MEAGDTIYDKYNGKFPFFTWQYEKSSGIMVHIRVCLLLEVVGC